MVLCVWGFENVLKKRPCLGNLCNNSLLECFTKGVCLFENMFQGFESCVVECVLKVGNCVLQADQVTKSFLPLNLLKDFFSCFNPFNSIVPPLYFGGQSCVRMLTGQARVIV